MSQHGCLNVVGESAESGVHEITKDSLSVAPDL